MRFLALFVATVSSSSALAQVSIKNPVGELYNRCLSEAIADNEIKTASKRSSYSCFGTTAKSWYDILGDEKAVHDKNGLFVARYYGDTGYCAHQIEDASGKPVSSYICEIVTDTPN